MDGKGMTELARGDAEGIGERRTDTCRKLAEDKVVARTQHRGMEVLVGRVIGGEVVGLARGRHAQERALYGSQIGPRSALRGEPRRSRLDDLAGLDEAHHHLGIGFDFDGPTKQIRIEHVPFVTRADHRSDVGPRRDEALAAEHLYVLAQGAAADLEGLAELRFGRQVARRGKIAAQNGARNGFDRLLVYPRFHQLLDGVVHNRLSPHWSLVVLRPAGRSNYSLDGRFSMIIRSSSLHHINAPGVKRRGKKCGARRGEQPRKYAASGRTS